MIEIFPRVRSSFSFSNTISMMGKAFSSSLETKNQMLYGYP